MDLKNNLKKHTQKYGMDCQLYYSYLYEKHNGNLQILQTYSSNTAPAISLTPSKIKTSKADSILKTNNSQINSHDSMKRISKVDIMPHPLEAANSKPNSKKINPKNESKSRCKSCLSTFRHSHLVKRSHFTQRIISKKNQFSPKNYIKYQIEHKKSNSSESAELFPRFINSRIVKYSDSANQSRNRKNEGKSQKIDFRDVSQDNLIKLIESIFNQQQSLTGFGPRDSFIDAVKREFGGNLNDQQKAKNFNFLPLKIVWSQFLSNEKVSPEHVKNMSAFEHLLFRAFLVRFGYVTRTQ